MGHVIENVEQAGRTVKLTVSGPKVLSFEDIWLRDNCRCQECYNKETFQRNIHILDLPDSRISKLESSKSNIVIAWDDGHKTEYSVEFLIEYDYKTWSEGNRLRPMFWRGSNLSKKVAQVSVEHFLSSEVGAKEVFQSLLDYGVAIVNNVEPTTAAMERVVKNLGVVQHTLFGGMWKFSSVADHADTAYSTCELPLHNDNTYFTEAAGLQILHCIEHSNCTGGETTLVDGFYGANRLQEEYPDDFDFLTKFYQEAEYLEPGHHHKHSAPVISVNRKTGDISQIRFNMNDRSVMAFSSAYECRAYYRAIRRLGAYYQDPEHRWQLQLLPGTVLIFDNFRVLHGRTAFSGRRVMTGCYISRSDWLDRARTLRLIR